MTPGYMGPKKNQPAEGVDDMKKSLDFLTEEVSAVRLQQKSILDLVEEVKALRIQNAEKDKLYYNVGVVLGKQSVT